MYLVTRNLSACDLDLLHLNLKTSENQNRFVNDQKPEKIWLSKNVVHKQKPTKNERANKLRGNNNSNNVSGYEREQYLSFHY